MKTIDTVKELIEYFGARLMGSQLFVEAKLLHEDDVNDIDLYLNTVSAIGLNKYLQDRGWSREDQTSQIRYKHPDADKSIDVISKADVRELSLTVDKLLVEKFNNPTHANNTQLQMVLFNQAQGAARSLKEIKEFWEQNHKQEE